MKGWPNPIAWDRQPLGKVPDAAIARKMGVSHVSVANARKSRRIPAYRGPRKRLDLNQPGLLDTPAFLGLCEDVLAQVPYVESWSEDPGRRTTTFGRVLDAVSKFNRHASRRTVTLALRTLLAEGTIFKKCVAEADYTYLRSEAADE